ncbi:MAG: alpha/beta fold hydrolase [Acidimicrobiales bacterium]
MLESRKVFVHERGEGPATLLLHGFPTSAYDWRRVVEQLAPGFHCVAPDLPGFGLSDKPRAYSYSLFQQADVIEALADVLDITSAHVVSHDMGTSVHTELLAREQEGRLGFRVLTSTFLNGSILKRLATLTDFQRLLESPATLDEAVTLCENMLPHYVAGLTRLMARPGAVSEEDAVVMTELLAYNDGHRRIPQVYAYVRERYLLQDRWVDAMRHAAGPLQILWASDDPVANRAMGVALAELVPTARFREAPGVGHFLPIEAPDLVADTLRMFTADAIH